MEANKRKDPANETVASAAVIAELQELLRPLTNEPLSLSLMAANAVGPTKKQKLVKAEKETNEDSMDEEFMKQAFQEQLNLFEMHIGPYADILEAAEEHVVLNYRDGVFYEDLSFRPEGGRYAWPQRHWMQGPTPDLHVWMGLFQGREAEAESCRYKEECEEKVEYCYGDIQKDMKTKVRNLPILELARNILRYLKEEAEKANDTVELLRFCATYGLSRAIGNVLQGKYGPVPGDLTVNTPLVIPKRKTEPSRLFPHLSICMPVFGIGALLGYTYLTRYLVKSLGADPLFIWGRLTIIATMSGTLINRCFQKSSRLQFCQINHNCQFSCQGAWYWI